MNDFLLVSNTNLRPILHRLMHRLPLFNALIWGEPPSSLLWNAASRNYLYHSIEWCQPYIDISN